MAKRKETNFGRLAPGAGVALGMDFLYTVEKTRKGRERL